MNDFWIGVVVILGTVSVYAFSKVLYKRFPTPLLLPVAISTAIIIIFLLLFNIPYDTYMIGGEWINQLLGPAVVALAYPLYKQRERLKRLKVPIIGGVVVGAIVGIASGVWLAKWFGFDTRIIYSLSPKSVTTPVAIDIAQSVGGITSLTAVFVMIAGVGGAMVSSYIFKLFKMSHSVGRGVGVGCASHAVGTAKLMEDSHIEGSISTIAMIVSAVVVSIVTPLFLATFP